NDVKGKFAKKRSLDRESDFEENVDDPSFIAADDPQPGTSGIGYVDPSADEDVHDIPSVKDAS
ncbi:hypothetical protein SK128_005630, partial [Halocaridina rubra]